MLNLKEYLLNESENEVYVIYLKDGTMYNFYTNEDEANKIKDSLNNDSKINGAIIKKEPRKNIEK